MRPCDSADTKASRALYLSISFHTHPFEFSFFFFFFCATSVNLEMGSSRPTDSIRRSEEGQWRSQETSGREWVVWVRKKEEVTQCSVRVYMFVHVF